MLYIAPNLNISEGLLIYPFTFLLLVLIYDKKGIKEAKQSVFCNFLLLLIFYLIMSVLNTLDATTTSQIISENLRNIFTPYYFNIKDIYIYYPDMINLLTFSLIYFLSHYIFIITYEAIENNSNFVIGFILAILIGFILDQMLYAPLVNFHNLLNNEITYNNLIEIMTANFICVIFMSVLMLIFYVMARKKISK
jgi:uncharacterized PurR-regulated membrane protein YhhQ (DUF165 family)